MIQASSTVAPVVPGRYKHFKGSEYQVLSVARHSETEEDFVVYRALNNPELLWVRPLEMFVGEVKLSGGDLPRFAPSPADARERIELALIALSGLIWRLGLIWRVSPLKAVRSRQALRSRA